MTLVESKDRTDSKDKESSAGRKGPGVFRIAIVIVTIRLRHCGLNDNEQYEYDNSIKRLDDVTEQSGITVLAFSR